MKKVRNLIKTPLMIRETEILISVSIGSAEYLKDLNDF